jgi:predicted acetyltransferase
MSAEAFGSPPGGTPAFTLGEGLWRWGMFDADVLAAKANDRAYQSMIGGRPVPTAGVAGVAVAPEYRGRGLARQMMRHLLTGARDRGAVVASLFRTAPALYRSLGFENVAELRTVELPTSALSGMRVPAGMTLRRATLADVPAARAVYDTVATQSCCLLTRVGESFPDSDAAWLAQDGEVTVAADEVGEIVGYLRWVRGSGFGSDATLSITDLQALTDRAHVALLATVGSFSAVTGVTRLRSSGTEPVGWFVPGAGWRVTSVDPYLMRVLDAPGAVAARGWPPGASGSMTFVLDDPVCPWNSGVWRLDLAGGEAGLTRVGERPAGVDLPVSADGVPGGAATAEITPCGLAVLYAGGVAPAMVRRAGMLRGGSADDDAFLAAAFAGPQPAILDFF